MTKITRKNKFSRKIPPTEKRVGQMFRDPFIMGYWCKLSRLSTYLAFTFDFVPKGLTRETYCSGPSLFSKRDTSSKKGWNSLHFLWLWSTVVYVKAIWMLAVVKNKPGGSPFMFYRIVVIPQIVPVLPSPSVPKYIFESIYELLDACELSGRSVERYSKRIDSFTGRKKSLKIKQDIASKNGANAHKKKKELNELISPGLGNIKRTSKLIQFSLRIRLNSFLPLKLKT